MSRRRIAVLAYLAAVVIPAAAQPLFDGALGTLPSLQGWTYFALPGRAEQTHTGSAARLLTTAENVESAGYALQSPVPLNRAPGFHMALRLRLHAETHSRPDRAGFSMIVLAEDRVGIELGFWTNLVFAQADSPLFTHAEDTTYDFHNSTSLLLSVRGTNYTLFADQSPILTGPLRNYTAFAGFPDVYETPNFLFLGDNTTSGGADVEIEKIALIPSPTLLVLNSETITWQGVPGETYTVESSAELKLWTVEARVHSVTTAFAYTNSTSSAPSRFLRVALP